MSESLTIQISPNPSSLETTISLPVFVQGQWILTNVSSKNVRKGIWEGTSVGIKVADLPAGLYFFQLRAKNGQTFVGKVVVQR